ncbi:hypothetical protein [Pseudoalteromonas nigrifaciens]|uniref:hypothetical protein n=1 Tax=Pseudoalteromonas nigrifaciens TaxID=28109 RepID=UPI003F9AB472
MKKIKLRPCHRCGEPAQIAKTSVYWAECPDCSDEAFESEQEAVESWNAETPTEKRFEELEKRCLIFFQDVLPQIGKLSIQDYENLNELGMLLEHPQCDIREIKS